VADPALITVRTQVVLDTLVGSMADAVAARFDEPLEPAVDSALGAIDEPQLARQGYLARAIEIERFERAREPMLWLAERLSNRLPAHSSWAGAAVAEATELALGEPTERPDPGDERAVSWKVPGPGGHVRYYLAMKAVSEEHGASRNDARRSWLSGFLLHCLYEAAPPGAA
jgi:hypothetical protein